MKQKLIFILTLFVVVLSVSYYLINNVVNVTSTEEILVSDYFPNREMIKVYNGGFENGGTVEFVDKVTENKVQTKVINTATGMINVYEISENKISLIYSLIAEDDRLKEDYLDAPSNREDIVLKGPIKKGLKWSDEYSSYEITNTNILVNTPVGEFEAVEISRNKGDSKSYYVKGLGHVKTVGVGYDSDLIEIEYNIEQIKKSNNLLELIDTYLMKY